MGHMHNFAGTRRLLWEHIDGWAAWVIAATVAERARWAAEGGGARGMDGSSEIPAAS
ncbi:hypothetical protein LO772_07030 [Yinghuangia sp. ASG 101]|uniref:hypothetical protein n=1 Tax=Yinghuangia sp. ASG 101 TaxID=2896848 RepID=UPI001E2FE966|nr:hypothetical protein [Yinghuangia sp. ASG 101]UGQ13355.1 hypothetical protein LO772_07030 [Yinghuangia sp. ASG 101]